MQQLVSEDTYKHSFVYLKSELDPDLEKSLLSFIAIRNLEQRVFLKPKAASSIDSYETTVLWGQNATLTPVLVVEIHGNHWQSFMQLLQQYCDRIPFAQSKKISLSDSSFLN